MRTLNLEAPLRVQALGGSTQRGPYDKRIVLDGVGGGVTTAVAVEERWAVASVGLYRPGRGAFLLSERNASGREKAGGKTAGRHAGARRRAGREVWRAVYFAAIVIFDFSRFPIVQGIPELSTPA